MLRNRIITAAVLIPLVVGGILLLPSEIFAWVIAALLLIGAHEMAMLGGLRAPLQKVVYVLLVAVVLILVYQYGALAGPMYLLWLVGLFWVLMTAALMMRRAPLLPVGGLRPGVLLGGAVLLAVAWLAVMLLHQRSEIGPYLVLFLFVMIWVADSGAYFAGRAFGKRKLAPVVSPGKTWAGAGGALVGAVLCGLFLNYMNWLSASLVATISLCLLVTAVSIGGDLFESLLKRQAGVKDSGNLLPGHGGALDRIDSLIAAAPVFLLGLVVLESLA